VHIHVAFTPDEAAAAPTGVVIDVIRATSTICRALASGYERVLCAAEVDDARALAAGGGVTLGGERLGVRIEGFDLGNSPREYTREAIEGKTILFTTTNGTVALVAAQSAREVLVGSFVNFTAVTAMVRAAARAQSDIAIIAAGSERHFSLEDTVCAGRFVRFVRRGIADVVLNDGAQAAQHLERKYGNDTTRLFADASHGRTLAEAGFSEDLLICSQLDGYPVVPVYQDRQVTKLGPDRER
jgi:2-phosphosulfolactate phosphatase